MSRLYFFSKSADKLPGHGINEFLSPNESDELKYLASIPHWRKVLSNFYEGEFEFENLHYRTAEHAFQAKKINLVDSQMGFLFSLESNSDLSRGDGEAARKQRKMVVLAENQIKQWNSMSGSVMNDIWTAKFSQVAHAKTVLLSTGSAELWHGSRGIPPVRWFGLEEIRSNFRN